MKADKSHHSWCSGSRCALVTVRTAPTWLPKPCGRIARLPPDLFGCHGYSQTPGLCQKASISSAHLWSNDVLLQVEKHSNVLRGVPVGSVVLWAHGNEPMRLLQVKICADAVINHTHAPGGGERRRSTRGSYFNATREEFPSVRYSAADFNDDKCTSHSGNIENYQDIYQV